MSRTTEQVKAGDPVNINYTVNTPQSSGAGHASRSVLSMAKPAMMGVGFLTLGTVLLGLFTMFRVPGLEDQIRDLEAEIDRLEEEIVELTFQNDRFEELNHQLNESLQVLVDLNDDLNETATDLEADVLRLNTTVQNLTTIKEDLEDERDRLNGLNDELEDIQLGLNESIANLTMLNESWYELNLGLENSTEVLSAELELLNQTNQDLQNVTDLLNETNSDLEEQNARLAIIVDDLTVVNDYLVNTGEDLSQALDQIVQDLNSSIDLNRENVFKGLFNYYNDLTTFWDCRNSDLYWDEPFFQNQGQSIYAVSGDTFQPLYAVLGTLEQRMLLEMCLLRTNFERYMTYEFYPNDDHVDGLTKVTYDEFESAVQSYGSDAISWYGLSSGTGGCIGSCVITEAEWEAASFDCNLLDNTYVWEDPRQQR